jgi:NCS1 family nucleobase:cation symporter-1
MTSTQLYKVNVEDEALEGRLPILPRERIYEKYGSFMWTCCAFSAATWAFLIGGYLPTVGDWRIGVLGYAIGGIIGMVLVTLTSGVPCFKYGTDIIDASKSSFGYRGIVVLLFGLLATLLGWTYVVEALTSRGASNIVATMTGTSVTGASHEKLVIWTAIGALFLVWLIATRGPKLFERFNGYIGPLHMLITLIMLWILVDRFGLHGLLTRQLPADQMVTKDKFEGLSLAVEFGMSSSMTWWPTMGGLTRLVKNKHHLMGPIVIGIAVLGAVFVSTVAALAAISAGTPDPTIWMITVGGKVFGSIVMAVVLTANVATMVVMTYLAGVSIQQIRVLAGVKWELLIALLLLPGVYFAFRTEWLLSAVMSWLSYNGVMFVGVTGIVLVDYYVLRKERLDVAHLFATGRSKYQFWGGFNWIAIVITFASTWGYLKLYDPVTGAMNPWFRYLGASIPTVVISAIAYYIAMKLLALPFGKGSYEQSKTSQSKATAGTRLAAGEIRVGL